MAAKSYRLNDSNRDYAIRLGCEKGLYDFITDYANEMGISRSSAVRRLVLIGAKCEKEHGKARMPASYDDMLTGMNVEEVRKALDISDEFDWSEDK